MGILELVFELEYIGPVVPRLATLQYTVLWDVGTRAREVRAKWVDPACVLRAFV